MEMSSMYFKLFACCFPVKGAIRAVICDVQRSEYSFIPIGLYEILMHCNDLSVEGIYVKYKNVSPSILDEYFEWLILKEYGFYTNEPWSFPKIKMTFHTPEKINNAIIDLDCKSIHNYESIFTQLDILGCKFIEIRSYDVIYYSSIMSILSYAKRLRFRNVDLILKYSNVYLYELSEIKNIFVQYPFIGSITFHSAELNSNSSPITGRYLNYTTQIIDSENCCGQISKKYFSNNLETYTESQFFNTCLNKKISIDKYGSIKNCPSMKKEFGNVGNISLSDVIDSDEFISLWKLKKDEILTCKVCEFRYMCTDCRAYTNGNIINGKPEKCNYNPYTAKWED